MTAIEHSRLIIASTGAREADFAWFLQVPCAPGYAGRYTHYSYCLLGDYTSWQNNPEMPKLYEYFGIIVLFYSNEHEPIHVHGKCQGRESKAELIIANARVVKSFIPQLREESL
jgi:Domain of unknown function (DUF4160)